MSDQNKWAKKNNESFAHELNKHCRVDRSRASIRQSSNTVTTMRTNHHHYTTTTTATTVKIITTSHANERTNKQTRRRRPPPPSTPDPTKDSVATYAYCSQKMLATTVAARPRPATVFTELRRARPKISSLEQNRCTTVTEMVLKV